MAKRKAIKEPARAVLDELRKCDSCGSRSPILVEMAGAEPWWLCSKCWLEPFVKLEGAKEDDASNE